MAACEISTCPCVYLAKSAKCQLQKRRGRTAAAATIGNARRPPILESESLKDQRVELCGAFNFKLTCCQGNIIGNLISCFLGNPEANCIVYGILAPHARMLRRHENRQVG